MSRLAILACVLLLVAAPVSAQDATASAVIPESGPFASTPHGASASAAEVVPGAHTFIVLRSGEQLEGNIRFVPSAHKPRYAVVDGERVELRDIQLYQVRGQKYRVAEPHTMRSLPAIYVQAADGRLALYRESNATFSTGADFYTLNDGPIRMVTNQGLRHVVQDHPVALAHLQRERLLGHVGMAGLVAGAGIMGVGTAIHFGHLESPHSGVLVASAGVGVAVVTNTIVPLLQRHARTSAVRAYNR